MTDPVIPLCSVEQFTAGAFGDLVEGFSPQDVSDLMGEATRACEDLTERRLAPFTVTETMRAEGIDPDEYADSTNLPLSVQSSLGASYAQALGVSSLVRHCWLSEYAVRYQDMWAYSGVQVTFISSYGGTNLAAGTQLLSGPEPDSGHLWFQPGTFLPVGSRIQVTYSGGYTVAVPASLVRAGKFMAAYLAIRTLEPGTTSHDPDQLYADAKTLLEPYTRD
jgi:hypothetical protein